MSIITSIRKTWGNGNYSPEFMRAQYDALTRQIPLLYAILIINMITPAIMYHGKAPFFLTAILPCFFSAIFVARALRMVMVRARPISHRKIIYQIRIILALVTLLGIGITAWSLTLFPYGDAYQKGQLTFFSGITIITVITCLMPLRQVGPIIFTVSTLPIALYMALQPETVYRAVAFNMVLIIAGTIFVLRRSHTEFRQRVEKQIELDVQRRQLERLNQTVNKIANEDALTALPNRRCFFNQLDTLIENAGQSPSEFAVGLIDLDGFKPVNDVLGHSAGDKLLVEVGRRLREAAPEQALIARLGGDEFGIILANPGNDDELRSAFQVILAVLTPSYSLDEGTVSVSGTCGVARYPKAGRSGNDLFERADFALYHSKQHERGDVTIFSDFHETAIKEATTIGKLLHEADLEEELYLEYQPIIDGNTGAAVGMEALARWQSPTVGNVPPNIFIRTAEQNGTIGRLTMTLFAKVLNDARSFPKDLYVSFNLSAHDLCSNDIMLAIFSMIGQSDISPARLVFEITESSVMLDFDRALASLDSLRSAGFAVALDDFGTGYSSLSCVRRLPIDRVKIDASFVQNIENDPVGYSLLKTMTEMCKNLNLQCIIEGVETPTQLKVLGTTVCTAYQGYYFARPMKAKTLINWLDEYETKQQTG